METIGRAPIEPDGVRGRSPETAGSVPEGAEQPLTCPRCHGVIVGAQTSAYTTARARLIVTNGYCQGDCAGRDA
ncbi:hypothetical protein ACGFJC_26985 [Nonomuraea fuscirosea]|uniref:hypothetical protein n=1 Tax=Nonomuraea fuscirosea TaxID=1291556 RepID=UPI00344A6F01